MKGSAERPRIAGVEVVRLHGAEFLPFAHHPHCERHHNHLIWFMGRPLCLGCSCLYSGSLVGLTIGLVFGSFTDSFLLWIAAFVPLVAPTAIQPFFQNRAFKIAARTSVGLASGIFWTGLLLDAPLPAPRWIWAVVLGALFCFVAKALLWLRSRFPRDPCATCPLGAFPTCSWNMERLVGGTKSEALRKATSHSSDQ